MDSLLEDGRKLLKDLRFLCKNSGLKNKIIPHNSPDHILEKATEGILASSDSTIIDRSELPVFDLPKAVLEFHFEPEFIAIGS